MARAPTPWVDQATPPPFPGSRRTRPISLAFLARLNASEVPRSDHDEGVPAGRNLVPLPDEFEIFDRPETLRVAKFEAGAELVFRYSLVPFAKCHPKFTSGQVRSEATDGSLHRRRCDD